MFNIGKEIGKLARLTNDAGQPNVNELWMFIRNFNAMCFAVKQDGYRIGREVYERILKSPIPASPNTELLLNSKPTTQADLESEWFRYWCNELRIAPVPHRKLWEFAYLLQNLGALGMLRPGLSALGFGCGTEPLPSYFASKGMKVTVTDLHPENSKGKGWTDTQQHTSSLDSAFVPYLIDRPKFDELVELQFVDMNAIPNILHDKYDLCWSVCALEHLGSIQAGLDFVRNSLKCLKPGGVAIHTTEFNYSSLTETIDNWPTVLFLRKHFETLAQVLTQEGHTVLPMDFNVGTGPLDSFVDLPPFSDADSPHAIFFQDPRTPDYQPVHIKLSVDGFPATCYGITVRRGPAV